MPHLLFQGDSITNTFRRPDERNDAYRLGAGYPLMASAPLLADHPGLSASNRGVCGHGLRHLVTRWEEDCLALNPSHLSLLIGTNDAMAMRRKEIPNDPAIWARGLAGLLRETLRRIPHVKILVMEPFQIQGEETDTTTIDHCKALARGARHVAAELGVGFLPLQRHFDKQSDGIAWIYDGIHPTARGHWLIAQQWLKWCRRTRWIEPPNPTRAEREIYPEVEALQRWSEPSLP